MAIQISAVSFTRYLAAQSTTRVSKVREAKRMMEAPHDEFKRIDYWLTLRDASIDRLTGATNARQYNTRISNVADPKKTANYRAAATGIQKWIGRKSITAESLPSKQWKSSGLEVSVTPELLLSWGDGPNYVVKLYFSADGLSKYQANPLLRLIECTHGSLGIAAVLDAQQAKLHTGPTARSSDLDLLLRTEAASYVSIWNSL
jgi:hypothetical protein